MQADGKNTLKRIEFVFDNKVYAFALNPEQYHITEPNRATITQTKSGAWVDEFGAGVPMVQFSGTTGFKNGTTDRTSGFAKFIELRDTFRKIYKRVSPGYAIPSQLQVMFYNFTDEDYWIVTPITFDLMRSVSRPHLFSYTIQLACLMPIGMPSSLDGPVNTDIVTGVTYQLK